ncbi:MAG: hypothetical protein HZB15_10960 [Actinobacteria bacterium]|nr:hypothetical protein [Actinomycetota bacterium]
MSNDHDSVERWHDAAALATFPIYEASNGSERWAGGFSSDGSHIEVIALVGGHEVSVATSLVEDDAHDTVRRRLVVGELLWHHVLEHDDELELPHSVTIEAEDRAVTVDGEPLTVSGMRIGHDGRWVGTARLGDVTVGPFFHGRVPAGWSLTQS